MKLSGRTHAEVEALNSRVPTSTLEKTLQAMVLQYMDAQITGSKLEDTFEQEWTKVFTEWSSREDRS